MNYRRASVPGGSYFFTLVAHERAPLFANAANVVCWRGAIANVQRKRPFVVEAEVLMPDHVHVVWTLPEGDADYSTRIRLVKTAFTKAVPPSVKTSPRNESRASKGEREVWQRRYWEHVIRDEEDFHTHVDYVHFNPVKHGLTKRPCDWPYSTFGAWVERGSYDPWWGSDNAPPLPAWAGQE